jgi:hypothetical protein
VAAWSSRVSVIRRQLLRCRLRQGQRRPTPSRRGRRCLVAFDSGSSPMCHCESGHGPWALLSSSHAHVPLHEPADRRRGEGRSRYLSSLGRGVTIQPTSSELSIQQELPCALRALANNSVASEAGAHLSLRPGANGSSGCQVGSAAVPLACYSQQSRTVLSGQPRTTHGGRKLGVRYVPR